MTTPALPEAAPRTRAAVGWGVAGGLLGAAIVVGLLSFLYGVLDLAVSLIGEVSGVHIGNAGLGAFWAHEFGWPLGCLLASAGIAWLLSASRVVRWHPALIGITASALATAATLGVWYVVTT